MERLSMSARPRSMITRTGAMITCRVFMSFSRPRYCAQQKGCPKNSFPGQPSVFYVCVCMLLPLTDSLWVVSVLFK